MTSRVLGQRGGRLGYREGGVVAEIGNQRRSDAGLDAGGRASCQGSWGWGGGGAERLLEFRLLEKARKCILL